MQTYITMSFSTVTETLQSPYGIAVANPWSTVADGTSAVAYALPEFLGR